MTDEEPDVETDSSGAGDVEADPTAATDAENGSAVATEVVRASGHENVRAEHESTLEVTTDDYLTPAGDCIVGVEADRALADFDDEFVAACQSRDARIEVTLAAGGHEARVVGRGDPELAFQSDRSLVVRTSDYVDERTVLLGADRAAADLDRDLVAALADGADLTVRLSVTRPESE